jgi:uncharacterized Zn-binding protein involved in type VI secretion
MTNPVVRVGDTNSGGGAALTPHTNITVNGKPLAKFMSAVSAHAPCPEPPIHCAAWAATPGSIKVTANGISVLRVRDTDSCGHSRIKGSMNTVCG